MFSDNQVSDLSPLKNLIQLTNLCFRRNQVTDRSVLTGLTQLGSFGDGECYFENQPL